MALPPLLVLASWEDYREHYINNYCRSVISTHDGIRVYFSPDRFGHAFRESSNRDGIKDSFSEERMQRMDWIKATLENEKSNHYCGWDNFNKVHDLKRRVSVVYESFVVILELRIAQDGSIRGKFVTCYQADNSINKITKAPLWDREAFIKNHK